MQVRILGTFQGHSRKDGTGQTGYSVYDENGIAPTILSHGGGYGIMIVERKLGNLYGYNGGNFAGNIYDKRGLCPALLTMQGGVETENRSRRAGRNQFADNGAERQSFIGEKHGRGNRK